MWVCQPTNTVLYYLNSGVMNTSWSISMGSVLFWNLEESRNKIKIFRIKNYAALANVNVPIPGGPALFGRRLFHLHTTTQAKNIIIHIIL